MFVFLFILLEYFANMETMREIGYFHELTLKRLIQCILLFVEEIQQMMKTMGFEMETVLTRRTGPELLSILRFQRTTTWDGWLVHVSVLFTSSELSWSHVVHCPSVGLFIFKLFTFTYFLRTTMSISTNISTFLSGEGCVCERNSSLFRWRTMSFSKKR